MRRLMFVAALSALAIPAFADDAAKKCDGEKFVINGKTYCMVAVDPEDYYRTTDKKPAPGSLVVMDEQQPRPRLKLSGHYLVNGMMDTHFVPDAYTYERAEYRQRASSVADLQRDRIGWGLSAQWSPDSRFWVEASWQRPADMAVSITTTQATAPYLVSCGTDRLCPLRLVDLQSNVYRFRADDASLALKWDLSADSTYVSLLLGGGVHRRYLRYDGDIQNTRHRQMLSVDGQVLTDEPLQPSHNHFSRTEPTTRVFGSAELELYPAGKSRWVGLGISGRLLSDGAREQQFFTDTQLDRQIVLTVQPGWYDVTARVILRF